MNNPKRMPHFSYNLSSPSQKDFGYIVADDTLFHRVSNFEDFYRALGYTDEIRMAGSILPDEFVWDRYTRDNAAKSVQCLQSQITVYLMNQSERFRKEFGSEYANMIGQCFSGQMDDSDFCVNCPMHPRLISLSSQRSHPV
ncbi:hypothetical protein SCD_n01520 [Sulfuricella denitrificans skB26]|uniref:Uncharacterized protein n=1 Tax=Sulfuricella denitrificans (strain DSM 22764 / NBRC 105220 / skB26) TaxID=1163617 RepID=S6B3X5_SULDS|nr:hypothetical protein [Sulfuricella denitrificans]BAN35342.1 hypothetical protein SCD_n01520 [Sulfuricella denitrificans skB26]